MNEDHLLNCEVMLPRLQAMGYTGSSATLRAYVHTLRPRNVGRAPVIRYETKPGEQMQFDWAEFHYERALQRAQVLRVYRRARLFADAFCHICQALRYRNDAALSDRGF
jgi:transposase